MREAALRGWAPWLLLGLVAAALWAATLGRHLGAGLTPSSELDRLLLLHSLIPRAATALLAGAALGLAGALLQSALDNPLAEPATLGVSAGAQLALTLAALLAPGLGGLGREAVAFAGGAGAVAAVLALTWRRGLDPVSVVLTGMIVAMVASSLSAALILSQGEYLFALLIWGGGSLSQQSWAPAGAIAAALALAALPAALLARPLGVIATGDSGARGLGAPVAAIRLAALGVGVALATTVAAEVGLIAFVGLAGPALARLSGARTTKAVLLASPLVGAVLLWLADGLVQSLPAGFSQIPTGAATALLGAPLMLWLLPRLKMADRPQRPVRASSRPAARTFAVLLALAALVLLAAVALGRAPDGWHAATGAGFAEVWPFRWPRTAAAAAAGAMLGAAGVIVQRMTGNPLASPEVLGVSAGAGLGLAVVMLLSASTELPLRFAGSACGALAALVLMLAMSGARGVGAERFLLAGATLSALCLAALNAVIATASTRAFALLGWISGSTSAIGPDEALIACAAAAALALPLAFVGRWLDVLPLGSPVARSLGLGLRPARLALTALAALLAAAASLIVGPLSFVGLVAPHAAYASGLTRPTAHLAGGALIGAILMVAADVLARTVIFPYQLPLGLFASLIGGAYLVSLLRTR
ncbi:Fe(3+)-hydroxamate ABC transporter permease FhuB [Methylopila sp. 73B]|uniref:Fe(3+)-hydroxamate ABC transporter permease FhuB n=1 Tax=Methylopila sp. 73B TaxID=1120792 RepID=UPI0003753679|nr:Fe(3+)-hydroxamate ABC transporter permease FhuB [Methylopila sp. 73B]